MKKFVTFYLKPPYDHYRTKLTVNGYTGRDYKNGNIWFSVPIKNIMHFAKFYSIENKMNSQDD